MSAIRTTPKELIGLLNRCAAAIAVAIYDRDAEQEIEPSDLLNELDRTLADLQKQRR